MIAGFTYKAATNQEKEAAKDLIFKVLAEYGFKDGYPHATDDIVDIEAAYQDGFFGLIYNHQNKLVGTFGLFKKDDKVAELRKMYLLPEARGKALGKWMLEFILAKAKSLGFSQINLETSSRYIEAIGLYQKYGFTPISTDNCSPACNRAFTKKI